MRRVEGEEGWSDVGGGGSWDGVRQVEGEGGME